MHIAFLTPEYPHPRTGSAAGIGTSIKNLVTGLVNRGIQVSIFVYSQKEDAVFMEASIKFHLIKHRKFPLFGWYLHRKFLQNYLNKFIAVDKIDALEAPDWTGITAFMKLKCPLVIRLHGSDSYFCRLEGRPQKKKNFWFEKIALQGADQLLSVSEFTAQKTREIFDLKKEIKVIPNAVDVEAFKPDRGKIIPDSILYFGSIIRKKGVLELAEIFKLVREQNPEAKLIMVGRDVPDISTGKSTKALFLEKLGSENIKNVEWTGGLPYEKVKGEISRAAVVVLPSFAEALPMTWLEAMSMEKALVTSDIGWAKEVMIDGKTGFTVYPKDHELYAKKVLELLSDPELGTEMGKAAREQVLEKFSTEVVVEENIKFYEGAVNSSKRDGD